MQITLNAPSMPVERLARAIERSAFATGRTVGNVIIQTTIFAAQSAAKATPISKKNRPVINLRNYKGKTAFKKSKRKQDGIPWWAAYGVITWRKGIMGTRYFKTAATKDRAKVIGRRGLARREWMRQLGRIGERVPTGPEIPDGSALTVTSKGGAVVLTRYENRVPYIAKIAPRSADIGVFKATRRMEKLVELNVPSTFKSAMRGVARVTG